MISQNLIIDLMNGPPDSVVFIMSNKKEFPITAITKTINKGIVHFTLLFNEENNHDKNH